MTPCGTVGYTAPEIVKDERYSKSVDMWALGCVLYTLLCGFPPFYDVSGFSYLFALFMFLVGYILMILMPTGKYQCLDRKSRARILHLSITMVGRHQCKL